MKEKTMQIKIVIRKLADYAAWVVFAESDVGFVTGGRTNYSSEESAITEARRQYPGQDLYIVGLDGRMTSIPD